MATYLDHKEMTSYESSSWNNTWTVATVGDKDTVIQFKRNDRRVIMFKAVSSSWSDAPHHRTSFVAYWPTLQAAWTRTSLGG